MFFFPIRQSPYVAILPTIHTAQGKASQMSNDVRVTAEQTGCTQHLYASHGGCLLVEDARFFLGVTVHLLVLSYVCPSIRPH